MFIPCLRMFLFGFKKFFFLIDIYIKNVFMKKVVRLTENDLIRIVKKVINEQYDETLKKELTNLGGNFEPIKLFSDKTEKNLVGVTFFDEIFRNEDGSINLYPGDIKFSSTLGTKSGYKVLLFKCDTQGLLSKGNGKILYNSKLENYLKSKTCGKNM